MSTAGNPWFRPRRRILLPAAWPAWLVIGVCALGLLMLALAMWRAGHG